jgi:hypothetical protein
MYPSAAAMAKSSKDEERSVWRSYVTAMASNKINIGKLPLEVHQLHIVGSQLIYKNEKCTTGEKITTSEKIKWRGHRGLESKGKKSRKKIASTIGTSVTEAPMKEIKPTTPTGENKLAPMEVIDLLVCAKNAWRERYGQDLPITTAFGDCYDHIGTVWTTCVTIGSDERLYTTTKYPPSLLDEKALPLPEKDGGGVAFMKQACAKLALYWYIVCTVSSVEWRRRWARTLLGGRMSALIMYKNKEWSTLSCDTNGCFWIEYNGRKQLLA